MKTNESVVLFVVLLIVSCANNNNTIETNENTNADTQDTSVVKTASIPDSFTIGKVIDSVICKSDASQSYALYIPVKGNKEILPVCFSKKCPLDIIHYSGHYTINMILKYATCIV